MDYVEVEVQSGYYDHNNCWVSFLSIERLEIPSLSSPESVGVIVQFLKEGEKIKAIKHLRQAAGGTLLSLKYTKLFVEYWMDHPEIVDEMYEHVGIAYIENKAW